MKSTPDLKNEVLTICGELTDGTSPYEQLAVSKLNSLYQGLLAGGSEFGIEIAEPWVWAQAKNSIKLALRPAFIGSATLTQGSTVGVLSNPPAFSLEGRFLRVDSRDDIYRVASHVSGSANFHLDQPYLASSGNLGFRAFKLDYKVTDDYLTITNYNNCLDFRENASLTLTALIPNGVYSTTELCVLIKTQMEAVGDQTYSVFFNETTRKFTVSSSGTYFDLVFASGPNYFTSMSEILGFEIKDYQTSISYSSDYILNGILRLSKPLTMYRETPMYLTSSRDVGKIFLIDDNSFLREFPLTRLRDEMPDKCALVERRPDGLWTLRMNNSVVDESVRAEVNFIPVTRKLVDNPSSFPLVPVPYTDYLVFGASHFVMLDKSDNRAATYEGLAKAKLQALVNDNRKGLTLGGKDFGKLVPRQGYVRSWGYYTR